MISAGARQSYDRWNNSPAVDAGNFEARTGNSEPVRLLRAIEGRSVGNLHEATSQRVLDTHQIEVLRNQAAMMAAVDGDVEAMKRLIEDGLDVNCSDYDRRTPLLVSFHDAINVTSASRFPDRCRCRTTPSLIVRLLTTSSIQYLGQQVASSEGRREIVKLLLKHGAAVEHRDRWASTACHEAERGGYHDIIRLLRQAGSKLMPTSSREDGSNS